MRHRLGTSVTAQAQPLTIVRVGRGRGTRGLMCSTVVLFGRAERRECTEEGAGGGGLLSGGEGVWQPKVCVPKPARPDFPNCKLRCFPRWSLWSGRGVGVPLVVLKTPWGSSGLVGYRVAQPASGACGPRASSALFSVQLRRDLHRVRHHLCAIAQDVLPAMRPKSTAHAVAGPDERGPPRGTRS